MPETLSLDSFYHYTSEQLIHAAINHAQLKGRMKSKGNNGESIDACKTLYRQFLENIVAGNYIIEFMTPETIERIVQEAYQRSEFDWKDEQQFMEFAKWYENAVG